jgi:hypothetical protein
MNANNPETAKANPLILRLLPGSPPGQSSLGPLLSIFTVTPGTREGQPDHDRSIVLDQGDVAIKFGDASSNGS